MDPTFTLAGKTKVVPPSAVSSGRYQFLSLSESEPNLGIPNSTGYYFLTSDITGQRGWANNLPDVNFDFIDSVEIRTNWLSAVSANIDELYVKRLHALSAHIDELTALSAKIDSLELEELFIDNLHALSAHIDELTVAVSANFIYFEALSAKIDYLDVDYTTGFTVGGDLGVTGNTSVTGNLTVIENITANDALFDVLEANHIKAVTKSFLVNHPTKKGRKLHYGSLESPYHGIRLTGKGVVSKGICCVNLPDYISNFVLEEDVNIQITNYKHDKTLYVDSIDIDNNKFTVKLNGFFNKYTDYHFFWSFTAIRKDVEKLLVEE